VGRRDRIGDLAGEVSAGAEAAVKQTELVKPIEGGAMFIQVLGLAAHRSRPLESKPAEVLLDRDLPFRPAARDVDILDAEQESPVGAPRLTPRHPRRESMAEVELTGGTRGEAGDRHRFGKLGIIVARAKPMLHIARSAWEVVTGAGLKAGEATAPPTTLPALFSIRRAPAVKFGN
jgi:hypothetical protein